MKEIEQAEFDRLEATLDKSFGRPTLEKEEVEVEEEEKEERMDDIFFCRVQTRANKGICG